MGNANSVSTGGVSSAIGPVLMRKVVPLTVQVQDISVPELDAYKDSIFASVAERLRNVSFCIDDVARPPEYTARLRMLTNQLKRGGEV